MFKINITGIIKFIYFIKYSTGLNNSVVRGAVAETVEGTAVRGAEAGTVEVWMAILESGWNLWVWLVGVVSRRWVWLGGFYGYGYNV